MAGIVIGRQVNDLLHLPCRIPSCAFVCHPHYDGDAVRRVEEVLSTIEIPLEIEREGIRGSHQIVLHRKVVFRFDGDSQIITVEAPGWDPCGPCLLRLSELSVSRT